MHPSTIMLLIVVIGVPLYVFFGQDYVKNANWARQWGSGYRRRLARPGEVPTVLEALSNVIEEETRGTTTSVHDHDAVWVFRTLRKEGRLGAQPVNLVTAAQIGRFARWLQRGQGSDKASAILDTFGWAVSLRAIDTECGYGFPPDFQELVEDAAHTVAADPEDKVINPVWVLPLAFVGLLWRYPVATFGLGLMAFKNPLWMLLPPSELGIDSTALNDLMSMGLAATGGWWLFRGMASPVPHWFAGEKWPFRRP